MVMRLKARPTETPVGRRDIVQVLASLDDDEFRALVDEARGQSLIPITELVLERLAPDVGTLAARLGDAVVTDDIGRQCVTRETARELFAAEAQRIAERKAEIRRANEENKELREARRAQFLAVQEAASRGQYSPPPPPDWGDRPFG